MFSLIAHPPWRSALVGVLALLALSPAAPAQTWTGASGVNGNWSTVANWSGGTQPSNGGTVTFNASSTGTETTTNDLVSSLAGISIGAVSGTAGTNPVSIGGNALTLGASGLNMTGATQDLTIGLGSNDLSLGGTQSWTMINGRSLTINSGHLFLSNTTASNTLTLTAPVVGGSLVLNTVIADSSVGGASPSNWTITSANAGTATATIQLLQANTYSGITTLNARGMTYQIGSDSPFGTGTVATPLLGVVPQLQSINGNHTISNPITLSGGFQFSGSNNLTFSGAVTTSTSRAITYNGAAGTVLTFGGPVTIGTSGAAAGTLTTSIVAGTTAATSSIVFNGVISEAAGVTSGAIVLLSNGTGTAALSSDQFNNQNTYSGGTNLNGALATAIVGSSSVLSGSTIVSGPLGTGALTANNAGFPPRIQAANGAQTVANNITLTSSLQVQGSNNLTLSGIVSGAGGLLKTGAGTLSLTGANTYSSASPGTTVTNGILAANNSSGSATGTSVVSVTGTGTVGSGGTLGGTGTISGAITISSATAGSQGGTIAPGNSVGTLNVGSMTWNPSGQYNFEHNTTANTIGASVNDFISGSGTLNLAGLASGTFNINLLPTNVANPPSQLTYTLATFTGGITGPSGSFPTGTTDVSSLFTLSGTYLSSPGSFAAVVGNTGGPQSLQVTFTPVPEPVFVLAACGGLTALAALRRRRS